MKRKLSVWWNEVKSDFNETNIYFKISAIILSFVPTEGTYFIPRLYKLNSGSAPWYSNMENSMPWFLFRAIFLGSWYALYVAIQIAYHSYHRRNERRCNGVSGE